MYSLIVVFYMGAGSGALLESTVVPGFESKALCSQAGNAIVSHNDQAVKIKHRVSNSFVCVRTSN